MPRSDLAVEVDKLAMSKVCTCLLAKRLSLVPTRTFLPLDDKCPACSVQTFPESPGDFSFGEVAGFGLEGLGENLVGSMPDLSSQEKCGSEKDNLLPLPPECPREVRNDTGVKLVLLWGAGRGQPLSPACSRLSYW